MDNDLFLYDRKPKELSKFKVVGLIPSAHFQKCRFLAEKMYVSFPGEYAKPEIRAMLNVDWDEYLTKMKRRHGKPYYLLRVPVVVHLNGDFLGDDEALRSYIGKSYKLETNLDFQEMAHEELIKYFTNIVEKFKRKFVYLTVALDAHVVGSLLFMLYNDLVPVTCRNFLSRCAKKESGYKRLQVHRIARYSWIQFKDAKVKHVNMPCENYSVPHDRRGVLSMCNERRHHNNSIEFYVTLEPADWMDYNYVAFGQLIQGAEILNLIENVSTYYQSPQRRLEITDCGEFTLCPKLDEEYTKALNPPYEILFSDKVEPTDTDSLLSLTGYKSGKYFLRTDVGPYLPFTRYSRMFDSYLRDAESVRQEVEDVVQEAEEEGEEEDIDQSVVPESGKDQGIRQLIFNSNTFYFRDDHLII